jgi:hypothetical protein
MTKGPTKRAINGDTQGVYTIKIYWQDTYF